jgi:hypothetical protein
MPDKYTKKPAEEHKIDYGTAKSHYANVRFKQGLPRIAGGDIKKGTDAYNEIVLLQKSLKEKDFVLLVAELADRSPEHWQMMAKYFEKRGYDIKIAGQVLAYAKTLFGESKGPLDSISNLAIAGSGGGPIQEAPKPLPPPLVTSTTDEEEEESEEVGAERGRKLEAERQEIVKKGVKLGTELVNDIEKQAEVEEALREFFLPEDKKEYDEISRARLSFPSTQIKRTPAQIAESQAKYDKLKSISIRVAQRLYWSSYYKDYDGPERVMSHTRIILDAYYGPFKELYPVVGDKVVGIMTYNKIPMEFHNMFIPSELDALEIYSAYR